MIKQRGVDAIKQQVEENDVEMTNANKDPAMGATEDQKLAGQSAVGASQLDSFDLQELSRYWDENIQDVIVDRSRAVDNELAELQ